MSLSKDEHKTNESTGEVGEGKHHTGMSLPGWVGKRGRGHTHTHAPPPAQGCPDRREGERGRHAKADEELENSPDSSISMIFFFFF